MKFEGNPVLARLIGRRWERSIAASSVMAVALAIATGVFCSWGARQPYSSPIRDVSRYLAIISILSHLLAPVTVALIGVAITTQYNRNQEHDLLYISTLDVDDFSWGYIFASLYRSRWLLALLVGFSPPLIIGTGAFFMIPFVVGAWGFIAWAAAAGVHLTLRQDNFQQSIFVAPLMIMFSGFVFITGTLICSVMSQGVYPYCCMASPFVLAIQSAYSARLWVRWNS